MTKILILDIETSPNVAYVWGAFKQNVGLNQLKENSYLMSFAAKWLGEGEVMYCENRHGDDTELVARLIQLLDEADIVIAHNAKKFDIPVIQGRAVIKGIKPPSPFKIIDTLLTARKEFRLFSNKLEYLAKVLKYAPKMSHSKFPGFELWLQCLKQNDEAWAEMMEYNIQDVLTLEEVYLRLRPWMKQHPNVAVKEEAERTLCPKCGSHHIHFRGYYNTNVGKYRKFQCQSCGGWGRTRHTEYPKDKRKHLAVNAA
jgi:DNA polymerase elongation subunit (family B)